jgi:hypothetical protein
MQPQPDDTPSTETRQFWPWLVILAGGALAWKTYGVAAGVLAAFLLALVGFVIAVFGFMGVGVFEGLGLFFRREPESRRL